MALISDVELDSGLKINDAYIRIHKFSGTENVVDFELHVFVDKASYEEGRAPLDRRYYSMLFDKNQNLYRQMYEHLLSLPEYEAAAEA